MKTEEFLIDYFPFEKEEILQILYLKAKRGLKLSHINNECIYIFESTDNINIHYDIYLFGEIKPGEEFYDSCKLMGWNFLCKTNDFAVFISENITAPLSLMDKEIDKHQEDLIYDHAILLTKKKINEFFIYIILTILAASTAVYINIGFQLSYDWFLVINLMFLCILCYFPNFILLNDLKKRKPISIRPTLIYILNNIFIPLACSTFVMLCYCQLDSIILFSLILILLVIELFFIHLIKQLNSNLQQKIFKHRFSIKAIIFTIIIILEVGLIIHSYI